MRFTSLRFLFVVIILSLTTPVTATDPIQEFEQQIETLFKTAQQEGYSRHDVLTVLKDARETQYRLLQAKTRTELEVLLSKDVLYIGPLFLRNKEFQLLSRQELQTKARTISDNLLNAHAEAKESILSLIKQIRNEFGIRKEFGTCSIKEVHSIETQLVKLSTLAKLFDSRVDRKQGVRTFNETFHRTDTDVKELQAMIKIDCMLSVLISRSQTTD